MGRTQRPRPRVRSRPGERAGVLAAWPRFRGHRQAPREESPRAARTGSRPEGTFAKGRYTSRRWPGAPGPDRRKRPPDWRGRGDDASPCRGASYDHGREGRGGIETKRMNLFVQDRLGRRLQPACDSKREDSSRTGKPRHQGFPQHCNLSRSLPRETAELPRRISGLRTSRLVRVRGTGAERPRRRWRGYPVRGRRGHPGPPSGRGLPAWSNEATRENGYRASVEIGEEVPNLRLSRWRSSRRRRLR